MIPATNTRGLAFVRALICRAATDGQSTGIEYAARRYGERTAYLVRTAVDAGSPNSGGWGAALATPEAAEFFGAVEQASVVGKLGLVSVAANVRTILLTSGATAYWIGRGAPKPVSKLALEGDTLQLLKVAALMVVTKESVRNATPGSELRLRNELVRACAEAIDVAFLDPDNAGVADEVPASVLNGVTPIPSAGDAATDVAALIAAFTGDLMAASFVTDPVTAARLALARDLAGSPLFPDAGVRGGSIVGLPLIVSRASSVDSFGGFLALIDAGGIAYSADGVRSVASTEAALEMVDDPAGPAEQVSMFQTNSVALLSEIGVVWKTIRPGAVEYVEAIDYEVSPS